MILLDSLKKGGEWAAYITLHLGLLTGDGLVEGLRHAHGFDIELNYEVVQDHIYEMGFLV